jgi:hypothetical protein
MDPSHIPWKGKGQKTMNKPETDEQIVDLSEMDEEELDLSEMDEEDLDLSEMDEEELDLSEMDEEELDLDEIMRQPTDKLAGAARQRRAKTSMRGAARPRPQGRGGRNRMKLVMIVFAGIAAIAVVFGIFSQSAGLGSMNPLGKSSNQATTIPSSTPLPTPKVVSTPLVPVSNAVGALILLNPGIVRQGTSMGVNGSGFNPRATVDLAVTQALSQPGQVINFVKTDKYGNFYSNLTVPMTLSSGTFFIQARERGSTKVAQARGMVSGGTPLLKLGAQVGKPGDIITVSLHGFSPGESIKVYWNAMSGQPVTTLQADSGGGIGQAPVQVPFGAAGVNTFLFVGTKSQSMVAASFDLLSLYPSIKLSNYAVRAADPLSFSGSGFGPGERVLVFLNSVSGAPLAVAQTNQHGTFSNAGGFVIPFALKGKQRLIFQGEESGASVAVNWTVQPYMPSAQTSTYGGLPGTTVSFYAKGFARQEVVHVYMGSAQNTGNMVSCFRTDDKGNVAAAGSYVIPGSAQGKVSFQLIGSQSGGTATATMSIMSAPSPVQVPSQPPFKCPLDSATN